MKNDRQKKTAKKFGILEKVEKIERELLLIPNVIDVEFDLDGFYDNLNQIIFLIEYDILASDTEYFNKRKELKCAVLKTAEKYNLKKSPDRIEDYGQHFYFVFDGTNFDW